MLISIPNSYRVGRYDGTLGQAKHQRDRPENVKQMEFRG